ncbi:MAG: hypothetical protein JSR65_09470 [Proteobacteria bacterium]|nr:hypothetical protein [Pseudomonadota bacterium]
MFAPSRLPNPIAAWRARGAVLFVSLVFLILLTVIALAAIGSSIQQERMTGGMRSAHLAHGGAESALREGETRLWDASEANLPFNVCGTAGLFNCYSFNPKSPIAKVEAFRNATSWVTDGAQTYATKDLTALGSGSESGNLSRNPVYLIEDVGIERPPGAGSFTQIGIDADEGAGAGNVTKHLYRITARSVGGSDAAMRAIESTFASKSN